MNKVKIALLFTIANALNLIAFIPFNFVKGILFLEKLILKKLEEYGENEE